MKCCFEHAPAGAHPVKLHQVATGRFVVQYGEEVSFGMPYKEAATQLGEAILHQLTCTGAINANSK